MVRAILKSENAAYKTTVKVRKHTFIMDEPESLNGSDLGATPMEHLAGALASCTTITLRMYLERKGWLFDFIEVEVDKIKSDTGKLTGLDVNVTVKANFDDKQWARVLHISKACPVHKLLAESIDIPVTIHKL